MFKIVQRQAVKINELNEEFKELRKPLKDKDNIFKRLEGKLKKKRKGNWVYL